MINDRKAALKKLKKLVYTSKQNIEAFRDTLDSAYKVPILPNAVELSTHIYGGIPCDVLEPEVYSSSKILMYIHGGSFVGGSRDAYRSFCASLAHAVSCRVVVPEFRLAPTNPFPNSLEDVQLAFRSIFTEEQVARNLDTGNLKNKSLPELIIAADGSGASIAIALILNLRERYRQCINNVILFSPWLNIADLASSPKAKKIKDEVLCADNIRAAADVYTYSSNLINPLISPVYAKKEAFEGFPPVYIQIGEKELLLEDAKVFAQKIKDAGGTCVVESVKDMMYMFQMADEYLEASHLAVERIGRLITVIPEEIKEEDLTKRPELEKSLNSED